MIYEMHWVVLAFKCFIDSASSDALSGNEIAFPSE
jgi:hypothetical protein